MTPGPPKRRRYKPPLELTLTVIKGGDWDAETETYSPDQIDAVATIRGFTVTYHLTYQEGTLVISGVHIHAKPLPFGGVTVALFRDLRTTEVVDEVRKQLQEGRAWEQIGETSFIPLNAADDIAAAKAIRRAPRWGRTKIPDKDLAYLFAVYMDSGKHAVKALMKKFKLEEGQVRGRINEARDRGIATRPPKGKVGGELTEYGLSLLPPNLWPREQRPKPAPTKATRKKSTTGKGKRR